MEQLKSLKKCNNDSDYYYLIIRAFEIWQWRTVIHERGKINEVNSMIVQHKAWKDSSGHSVQEYVNDRSGKRTEARGSWRKHLPSDHTPKLKEITHLGELFFFFKYKSNFACLASFLTNQTWLAFKGNIWQPNFGDVLGECVPGSIYWLVGCAYIHLLSSFSLELFWLLHYLRL